MIKASIDIGSNSILLLIAEVDQESKKITELLNESKVTSLGKNLDEDNNFCKEAMDESYNALGEFLDHLKRFDINTEDVIVTATEASRVASNAAIFFKKIHDDFGLNVQIITGEGEAYFTGLGVSIGINDTKQEEVIIMDIGGASTELIKVKVSPFKLGETISLPIGSVRATDWIKQDIFVDKVEEALLKLDHSLFRTKHIIAVAGTMTSLACMMSGLDNFDQKEIQGLNLPSEKLNKFVTILRESNLSEEKLLEEYPFLGKRSSSIVGGARIAKAIGIHLEIENFEISTYGLRYGTLYEGEIAHGYLA